MSDYDITDRGHFDLTVTARFPKARRTRKEARAGWEDTFKVGLLEVNIRVHVGVGGREPGARPAS